jgi:hypothetical protein
MNDPIEFKRILDQIDALFLRAKSVEKSKRLDLLLEALSLLCILLKGILQALKSASRDILASVGIDPDARSSQKLGRYLQNPELRVFQSRDSFGRLLDTMITGYEIGHKRDPGDLSDLKRAILDQYDYMLDTYLGVDRFEDVFSSLKDFICDHDLKARGKIPWWLLGLLASLLSIAQGVEHYWPKAQPPKTTPPIVEPAKEIDLHMLTVLLSLSVFARWIADSPSDSFDSEDFVYFGVYALEPAGAV